MSTDLNDCQVPLQCQPIDSIIDQLGTIRANIEKLRQWGQEQKERADIAESKLATAQEEIAELSDDIVNLEDKIKTLNKE